MNNKKECVVILAFHDYQDIPFDQWYPEYNFIFLAPKANEKSWESCPSQVLFLDDYSDTSVVLEWLKKIKSDHKIKFILARAERDVMRAAILRQLLDVEGLTVEESAPFRDKDLMYKQAKEKGLPLMPFQIVESFLDANSFFRTHGRSVIKPSCGSGSSGVEIITSEADLLKAFVNFGKEDVLIQKFCEGAMCHLDGIWTGSEVRHLTGSSYINTCISFKENIFLGSVIDESHQIPVNFDQCAAAVLEALGVQKPLIFHLEIFVNEEGWHFCEIACRPGGSRIVKTIEAFNGINLDRKYFEYLTGLDKKEENLISRPTCHNAAGWLIIPPRKGQIKEIKYPQNKEWIWEFRESKSLFDKNKNPAKSGDYLLTFVVTGNSSEDVKNKITLMGQSITQSIVMEA